MGASKTSVIIVRFLLAAFVLLVAPLLQVTTLQVENASASSGAVFDVTKFGAKPDDSIGDTKNIANAIDSAIKNNGGYVYFPKGTYIISDTLYIDSAKNVNINGEGTIKLGTTGKDVFNIVNSHWISVSGLSIQGWQDGTKSEIDSNGDLAIGSGIRADESSDNITIKNCKIFNQNINGISISDTSKVTISNCEISNTRTSIRLDTVSYATIKDNHLQNQDADGLYVIGSTSFQDILFESNNIEGFGDTAIDVTGAGSNIKLWWNEIHDSIPSSTDPNGLGISISSTIANFQVISNKISNVAVGMSLDASFGTISNNEIDYKGISTDWTKLRVQNRYVVDMGSYNAFEQFGMSVGGSNLEISGNTITSPSHVMKPVGWDLSLNKIRNYGIKVFASNNLISDNSLSLYTDKDPIGYSETANVLNYGIKIGGSASGVTVDSNTLHLMPGASYDSIIEKSTSNKICVQLNNIIINDGKTKDLIKGF